jgi:hypothetical protein
MRFGLTVLFGLAGAVMGILATLTLAVPVGPLYPPELLHRHKHELHASSNDRYQDFIMCTGAVAVNARAPTDGLWILDFKSGKLLASLIDRTVGKITGWAEADLVTEFNIPPKQDVHFMMTTGTVAQGQVALYVAEVTTGKFGVYSMGPNPEGTGGLIIRRHDLTTFRAKAAPGP